jgi:hypothetical protein
MSRGSYKLQTPSEGQGRRAMEGLRGPQTQYSVLEGTCAIKVSMKRNKRWEEGSYTKTCSARTMLYLFGSTRIVFHLSGLSGRQFVLSSWLKIDGVKSKASILDLFRNRMYGYELHYKSPKGTR